MSDISKLLDIMAALRDPESGCPWDLEQTFATIAPYTLEEAYEVVDAIERDAIDELPDELGDLLFQVVFYARMAQEAGRFDFGDIVACICDKMVRRHPHVFSNQPIGTAAEQTVSWESIKAAERGGSASGALSGVPLALPALSRASKLGKRASTVGFDWPDAHGARGKIDEELGELAQAQAAGDRDAMVHEYGDVLFALTNLGRHLGLDPEACLRAANGRFEARFRHVEAAVSASDKDWTDFHMGELDALWERAKDIERRR